MKNKNKEFELPPIEMNEQLKGEEVHFSWEYGEIPFDAQNLGFNNHVRGKSLLINFHP